MIYAKAHRISWKTSPAVCSVCGVQPATTAYLDYCPGFPLSVEARLAIRQGEVVDASHRIKMKILEEARKK